MCHPRISRRRVDSDSSDYGNAGPPLAPIRSALERPPAPGDAALFPTCARVCGWTTVRDWDEVQQCKIRLVDMKKNDGSFGGGFFLW